MSTDSPTHAPVRRRPGLIVVSLLLLFLGVNALAQAVRLALGLDPGPLTLTLWQVACGVTALLAAAGAWLGERWSADVIVAYGLLVGTMILSLQSMLGLPPEAQNGLIAAGVCAFVVCALLAWYVARASSGVQPDRDR